MVHLSHVAAVQATQRPPRGGGGGGGGGSGVAAAMSDHFNAGAVLFGTPIRVLTSSLTALCLRDVHATCTRVQALTTGVCLCRCFPSDESSAEAIAS